MNEVLYQMVDLIAALRHSQTKYERHRLTMSIAALPCRMGLETFQRLDPRVQRLKGPYCAALPNTPSREIPSDALGSNWPSQHHGLPTRLLTECLPKVAAHFATYEEEHF